MLQVGVKAVLRNADGKVLLLKRSSKKYGKTQGSWDIPGGRIDAGSSLTDNLKREILEEVGLDCEGPFRLVAAQDIILSDKHVVRLTFVCDEPVSGGLVLDESENQDYVWIKKEKLSNLEDLDVFVKEIIELI
jgi:ADP-ribose pyrophosphatase YjhB (NUDIX family)